MDVTIFMDHWLSSGHVVEIVLSVCFAGRPVDVVMSIDISSIDMVSEVNMVSLQATLIV